jgi:hypothetical protein
MARTIGGNLTGRAASIQLREVREQLAEMHQAANDKLAALVSKLQADDPEFDAWWDAQDVRTNGDMVPLMESRLAELQQVPA